ncbi:queuosine precursor transporter [Clostridioides difficile]
MIVTGHTRYEASKILDLKQVPCLVLKDLTEEEIRGYRLALNIPALEQSVELQNSLKLVLNQGVRMTLASLGAFSCSQFLDIYIFHRLKEKHSSKYKWLRNNASTMTSQFIDTIIFITIAFCGVVDNLFLMVIAQYTVKFFLALLDTPFFYLLTREETKVDKQAS